MIRKRTLVTALAGLNLLLLAGLILASYEPPAAYAQGRGRPGDYVMATCQVHSDYDVLAVINAQKGLMFIYLPRETRNGAKLVAAGFRNLNRDFAR